MLNKSHEVQLGTYAASMVNEARVTEADKEVLAKIAANTLMEHEAQQHILRLILTCADLRRRLESR